MIEFLVEVDGPDGPIYQRYWQTFQNLEPTPNCEEITQYLSTLEIAKKIPQPSFMSIGRWQDSWRDSIYDIGDWLEALSNKLGCQPCR